MVKNGILQSFRKILNPGTAEVDRTIINEIMFKDTHFNLKIMIMSQLLAKVWPIFHDSMTIVLKL